jgi:hypothetical protein
MSDDIHSVIEVPPANFWYAGVTVHWIHMLQNVMGYKWNSNSWDVSVLTLVQERTVFGCEWRTIVFATAIIGFIYITAIFIVPENR